MQLSVECLYSSPKYSCYQILHNLLTLIYCSIKLLNSFNLYNILFLKLLITTLKRMFYSFRASEPDDLVEMQQKEWDPLLSWFNKR